MQEEANEKTLYERLKGAPDKSNIWNVQDETLVTADDLLNKFQTNTDEHWAINATS